MRLTALTLIGSLALAAAPAPANAAPAIQNIPAPAAANLIQIADGCGPAFHRNPWGYCVANYGWGYGYGYGYYRPHFAWGWGYHPYWHHWHW